MYGDYRMYVVDDVMQYDDVIQWYNDGMMECMAIMECIVLMLWYNDDMYGDDEIYTACIPWCNMIVW